MILNFIKSYLKLFQNLISKIKIPIPKINLKFIKQNETKIIFYIITLGLPVISIFLFQELKGFNILLISYSTFLTYISICILQNMCILSNKNCENIEKVNQKDLIESLLIGFSTFTTLFIINRFYKVVVNIF